MKNLENYITRTWDDDIIPLLCEYIKIPNKSPLFDADWETHGYMDDAMQLLKEWCERQPIKDMQIKLMRSEKRTPLLLIDIPGQSEFTTLLYGHMDKQPEMTGWDDDLGPWKPVIKDGKLYGRGGADDGYSTFAAINAIAALQQEGIPHGRCIVLIEASEESGSVDLPHYLNLIKADINTPNLIICLDSSCANYEQIWSTTSLRGLVGGDLSIEVLTEGIHSGVGSGAVPSTFSILRTLLDRIENKETNEVLLDELKANIPPQRIQQAQQAAAMLNGAIASDLPFIAGMQPLKDDMAELLLNRTWRASLSVTGMDGLPNTKSAGNVTIPKLSVKLSMRIPPTCNPDNAKRILKDTLEKNPPFNAKVTFHIEDTGPGWHAPELSDWLAKAADDASMAVFNKPAGYIGEGGSIPFMGMLGEMFPKAQFLITGVLGPKSNAHGPNEFLHLKMAKQLTSCIARVIASHYRHFEKQ